MPFKNPHPLYSVWQGMRRRCRNPNYKQWSDYGGRGISICPSWDNFHKFVEDMGSRPTPKHTLDRIDNDKDYGPRNCRWATRAEQQRNRRNTVFVKIEGETYKLSDIVDETGIKADTIATRVNAGLSLADIKSGKQLKRGPKPKTHCKWGHEYTEQNTLLTPKGHQCCRACHNAKMRRYSAAKRKANQT